jgi:PAS domain S-box-containing protein
MPIIYANKGFEAFSGYTRQEIIGKNCRFMQLSSRTKRDVPKQESAQVIRNAIAAKLPCVVDLLNYKKDGSRFFNRLSLRPVFDSNDSLRYYIGIQSDVTSLVEVADDIFRHLTDTLNSALAKGA